MLDSKALAGIPLIPANTAPPAPDYPMACTVSRGHVPVVRHRRRERLDLEGSGACRAFW